MLQMQARGPFCQRLCLWTKTEGAGNLNTLSTADQVQEGIKEVQNLVSLAVSPTMSYYITVQVHDLSLQLMVDTGAAVSLLRREQWSSAEKHKMEQWDGGRLVGVEGSHVEVDGVVTMDIHIGDVTVYKGMEVAVATRVEENHLATTHSSGHSTYTEKQVEIPWEKKELLLKLVKECEEDLSEEEREQLFILLLNYADVFAGRDGELGRTFLVQHSIATEDTRGGDASALIQKEVLILSDEERRSLLDKAGTSSSIELEAAEVLAIKVGLAVPWKVVQRLDGNESDFDPRPPVQKGTAPHLLKDSLTNVKGKGLGVSLLFDNDTTVWKDENSLVKQLLHQKGFSTQATIWGKENEDIALEKYMEYKKKCGNNDLITCKAGFVICEKQPFLVASPDAYLFDPSGTDPYGLIEIKCPFKYCDLYPEEASRQTDFFCTLSMKDGRQIVELKHNHPYFAQVQGQLAITERSWCDFVVYTKKGISVERIQYSQEFWRNTLLPKLIDFYDNCLCPSIVAPIHLLGMKVHDLRVHAH
ncbi:hypothetical protein EMCRGX_G015116 [Ephydatia muelleri]